MHDFPPPLWPPSNYPVSDTSYWMVAVAVLLSVCSIRVSGGQRSCIAWSAASSFVFLSPFWGDRHWSMLPGTRQIEMLLLGLILLVCLQANVRAILNHRKQAGLEFRWIGLQYPLGGIAIGVVLAVCATPPAVSMAREGAARTMCKNNLKQIGLALHAYHDLERSFPMASVSDNQRSWRVTILPHLDAADLYQRYDQNRAWDSAINSPLAEERVGAFDCYFRPDSFDERDRFLSAYAAIVGPGAAFDPERSVTIASFTDGLSNTIMVTEACGKRIVWTEPRDVSIDQDALRANAPGLQLHQSSGILSSYHQGGAQVLLADGSVRFVSQNLDISTMQELVTRNAEQSSGQQQLQFGF